MSSTVEVSVITTTYNSIDFLPEAIESIRKQTFINYEHIVINDGSSDGTRNFLNQIQDPKLKVFNLPRTGRGKCLNFGISKARGKYIAILDSDDISSEQRLMIQSKFLDENPFADVVSSEYVIRKEHLLFSNKQFQFKQIKFTDFFNRNPICHSSVLIRKKVLTDHSNYNQKIKVLYDLDLWVRLLISNCSFYEINLPLAYKRLHPLQFFEKQNRFDYLYKAVKLKKKVLNNFSGSVLNYLFIYLSFVYGFLPSKIRQFLNLR